VAFGSGTNAVVKIQNASDVMTDLSAYLDKATLDRNSGTYDTTTFGKSAHVYIGGLKDGTIPFEGPWDPTIDGVLAPILGFAGAQRTFEYYPNGTGTGAVKYTGAGILNKYSIDDPVDGRIGFTAGFQISDNLTRAIV